MNHCDKLFPAIYGNLDSETGFDTETVTITTISNRTDYVKLSNRNGNAAYMICDFTQWENLPRNSKRDHCKLVFFFSISKNFTMVPKSFWNLQKNLTRYFLYSNFIWPLQGPPLGIDIMHLILADRNMQVRFGLKVVWESWIVVIWLMVKG